MQFSQLWLTAVQGVVSILYLSPGSFAGFQRAMAHAKQPKEWEQKQRHRVAHRDPEVPPGPRIQQVWADAKEALQSGTGNCMQPLWGAPLHKTGASSSAAEPGAGNLDTPLRELQEVCRQHA